MDSEEEEQSTSKEEPNDDPESSSTSVQSDVKPRSGSEHSSLNSGVLMEVSRASKSTNDLSQQPSSSSPKHSHSPRQLVTQKYVLGSNELARDKPFSRAKYRKQDTSGDAHEQVELKALNPRTDDSQPAFGARGYAPMRLSFKRAMDDLDDSADSFDEYIVDERGSGTQSKASARDVRLSLSGSLQEQEQGYSAVAANVDTVDASVGDAECGETSRAKHMCLVCLRRCAPKGRCQHVHCRRMYRENKRCRWLVYATPVFLLLCLFVVFMPFNFVYLDYHEMALVRTKSSGVVDKDVTFYAGCHLLGVDSEFVRFKMSGHVIKKTLSVFSASRLIIDISFTLIYFIRPKELGALYIKYGGGYEDVIDRVLVGEVKNTMSPFTVDFVREQRHAVEQILHAATRNKLNDFHVDVRFLWLGYTAIPPSVSSKLLNSLLQQVSAETEVFDQKQKVVAANTNRLVSDINHRANEVREFAVSGATFVNAHADARAEQMISSALHSGWEHMCQRLNFEREDQKLSLLFVHSLNKMDNLYLEPSEYSANFTYTHFTGL